jgi:hypothetical protein
MAGMRRRGGAFSTRTPMTKPLIALATAALLAGCVVAEPPPPPPPVPAYPYGYYPYYAPRPAYYGPAIYPYGYFGYRWGYGGHRHHGYRHHR